MNIKFSEWVRNESLSSDVSNLFDESIRCFAFSAFKASMIFSYLAFMTILKERILKATMPDNFPERKWKTYLKSVQNDDIWDKTIIETTQVKDPVPIFNISEDLRQQIVYWKNRRNDCAHFKDNEITYFHVEGFWSFLRSNLAKIKIQGSKKELMDKIDRHFDISITSPNKDLGYILQEIPHAISKSEIPFFFGELHSLFESRVSVPIGFTEDELKFYDKILGIDAAVIKEKLIEYLSQNELILEKFIKLFPKNITLLSLSNEFVRKLCIRDLFNTNSPEDMEVFCSLLRNDLIKDDKKELYRKLFDKGIQGLPDENQSKVLEENEFFQQFHDYAFRENKISEIEFYNTELIIFYVTNFEIDYHVASALSKAFQEKPYNLVLRNNILEFFKENEAKKASFVKIIKDNTDLYIPENLPLE